MKLKSVNVNQSIGCGKLGAPVFDMLVSNADVHQIALHDDPVTPQALILEDIGQIVKLYMVIPHRPRQQPRRMRIHFPVRHRRRHP